MTFIKNKLSIFIMFRIQMIISIIILFTFSSVAQEYKGNIMLNATIGGVSTKRLDKYPDEEETHPISGLYNINLKGGYFITNKSSIGILFGYSWERGTTYPPWDDTITNTNRLNTFDIGPYYKGYFKLIKRFYFTLNVSPHYRVSSLKKSFPEGEYESYQSSKESGFYLSVLPGFSFEINKNFNIEFEIGFFDAYVKSRNFMDSPIATKERHQVIYGTSTSINEFSLHDIKFGFTYRIKIK